MSGSVLDGAPASTAASSSSSAPAPVGVRVQFRPVGSAPALRRPKVKAAGGESIAAITRFLRTQLALAPGDSLWLYCATAFVPAPDDTLDALCDTFGVGTGPERELLLHYSLTAAYG
jgi:ubiquitin-like protein ATG12